MFAMNPAATYQRSQTDFSALTASPAELVALLLEAARDRCRQAAWCVRAGNPVEKGVAVEKAQRIIQEGLQGHLDMSVSVSSDFDAFYSSALVRLLKAHASNDDALFDTIAAELGELASAWRAIPAGQ